MAHNPGPPPQGVQAAPPPFVPQGQAGVVIPPHFHVPALQAIQDIPGVFALGAEVQQEGPVAAAHRQLYIEQQEYRNIAFQRLLRARRQHDPTLWQVFKQHRIFLATQIEQVLQAQFPGSSVAVSSPNYSNIYFYFITAHEVIAHASFHLYPPTNGIPGEAGAFHIKSDRHNYYIRYTPLTGGNGNVYWKKSSLVAPGAPLGDQAIIAQQIAADAEEQAFGQAVFRAINHKFRAPQGIQIHGGGPGNKNKKDDDCYRIEMTDEISITMTDIDDTYKVLDFIYDGEKPDELLIYADGKTDKLLKLEELSEEAQKAYKVTFEMAKLLIHPEEVPVGTKEDIDKLMETEWGKKHIIIDETNNTTNKNKPANSLAPTVSNAAKNKNKLAATTTADPPANAPGATAAQGGKRKTRKHKQKQKKQRKTRSRR